MDSQETPTSVVDAAGQQSVQSLGAGQSVDVNNSKSQEKAVVNQSGVPGSNSGGRRRRRGSKKYNPWLAHVKETMRKNRGVSFKNVLKLAKKSFKSSKYGSKSKSLSHSHSHSHSQSAGRRRGKRGGNKSSKSSQNGGSGMAGKAPFGENAAPVV